MMSKLTKGTGYDARNGLKDIKMKDRWRYHCVGDNTWKIDNKGSLPCPEDDIIAQIDDPLWEPPSLPISGLEMISILPERLKRIMFMYLWEGKTMSVIGGVFDIKRARVCQLVKEAYSLIQSHYCNNKELNEYVKERRSRHV